MVKHFDGEWERLDLETALTTDDRVLVLDRLPVEASERTRRDKLSLDIEPREMAEVWW